MKHSLFVALAAICLLLMDIQVGLSVRTQGLRGPIRGLDDADLSAHRCLLMHDVGNAKMTLSNWGEMGSPDGTPGYKGFEFPRNSGNDFLFSGGIWVAAELEGAHFVSTTTDGDNGTNEFWPVHIGTMPSENATPSFGDWYFSSSAFVSDPNHAYVLGIRGVDDDNDWTVNDDFNGDGVPSKDWDGIEMDGNEDGNPRYDPESHVDEDPAGDISSDHVDNDFDGLADAADSDLDGDLVIGSPDDDNDGEFDEDAGALGHQEYYTVFQDSIQQQYVGSPDGPHHPLQVEIQQRSYTWADTLSEDIIFIEFRVRNFGAVPLTHVYLTVFADADVTASGEGGDTGSLDDSSYYDASRLMMVMTDSNTDGDGPLPGNIGYKVVHTPTPLNDLRVTYANFERTSGGDPPSDADKYNLVSSGIISSASNSYGDWRMLLAVGDAEGDGFTLLPGNELPITIAVLGGSTLTELAENADRAQSLFDLDTIILQTDEPVLLPTEISLHQNYPNPFNPVTEITFDLSAAAQVELAIYNTVGQRVEILTNELRHVGTHRIQWDGSAYASGIYLLQLKAGTLVETRKMVLMK